MPNRVLLLTMAVGRAQTLTDIDKLMFKTLPKGNECVCR